MKEHYRKVHKRLAKTADPESLALSYGYSPALSEGAVVPPIFLASTYVFPSAEAGMQAFALSSGLREPEPGEEPPLIYSRMNNPNLQIIEERLALIEGAEAGLGFSSGMAAISTLILSQVRPGRSVVFTEPIYGGTHHLFDHIFPDLGIHVYPVPAGCDAEELRAVIKKTRDDGHPCRMVFMESPANPTLRLTDIALFADVVKADNAAQAPEDDDRMLLVMDNTFLGPIFCKPIQHGADLVVYSATKFIGGHSDVVGGFVLGSKAIVHKRMRKFRSMLGGHLSPFDAWLCIRSVDTLKLRMDAQARSAAKVADWLKAHPKVDSVHFPGHLEPGTDQARILSEQCTAAGSMIAFDVGSKERSLYLDSFDVFKLAVSLGGTHSLVESPAFMTHLDVSDSDKARAGVTPGLIRLSIGVEDAQELINDLESALASLD